MNEYAVSSYDFYAFPTKVGRDTWVEENEFDGTNYVAAPITRRALERVVGKNFKVVDNYYGDGLNVVVHANEY